jgi:hypothetical protein
MRQRPLLAAFFLASIGFPLSGSAQGTDTISTRAQGMGGAFVGVADDASAVYWNPAGLAGGAYFSLVVDGTTGRAVPSGAALAGDRSGWILAVSMPAWGLSYYRLHSTFVGPSSGVPENSHVQSLVTQHVGSTFVHSLFDGVAVGATVKIIRGVAASADVPGNDREELLDHVDLIGHASNKVDVDAGVMATGAAGRAGLTVRNLTAPGFETAAGLELELERQVRAGASVLLLPKWKLAADVDLTRHRGVFSDVREFSLGSEAQITGGLAARAGFRFNTIGDAGHSPAVSAGATYAVFGSLLVDAQVTGGSDNVFRGWGLAGRFVF